jgi:hypothetical protein
MDANDSDRGFESWARALNENALKSDQIAVLQEMVDDGQAATLAQAAQRLDWQETVIDPSEHMYGH